MEDSQLELSVNEGSFLEDVQEDTAPHTAPTGSPCCLVYYYAYNVILVKTFLFFVSNLSIFENKSHTNVMCFISYISSYRLGNETVNIAYNVATTTRDDYSIQYKYHLKYLKIQIVI